MQLEVQVKFTLEQATKAERGSRCILYFFFNLSARWGWVVNASPRPLYTREWPGTHCTGGWVDPRAGLEGAENLAPTGFDPRTVQPVSIPYTDWAVRTHDEI